MSARDPYRRIAGFYDRLIEPMQAGVRRVALEVVPPRPGWQVLDVGCGTGTGLAHYVAAGCTATGVDVSEAMLAKAKRVGSQVSGDDAEEIRSLVADLETALAAEDADKVESICRELDDVLFYVEI